MSQNAVDNAAGNDASAKESQLRFIDGIVTALKIGAAGTYTIDDLQEELKKKRVSLNEVHLTGSNGMFEPGKDGKLRLRLPAVSLLLTYYDIDLARDQANDATRWAIVAIVIAIIGSILNFLTLLWAVFG